MFNFRARSIEQSSIGGAASTVTCPYTLSGLQGMKQVIGIADTGLDVTSCYFVDPSGKSVTPSDLSSPITTTNFRKVIQYTFCKNNECDSDTIDQPDGHGTHVVATAVGSILNADIASSSKQNPIYFR